MDSYSSSSSRCSCCLLYVWSQKVLLRNDFVTKIKTNSCSFPRKDYFSLLPFETLLCVCERESSRRRRRKKLCFLHFFILLSWQPTAVGMQIKEEEKEPPNDSAGSSCFLPPPLPSPKVVFFFICCRGKNSVIKKGSGRHSWLINALSPPPPHTPAHCHIKLQLSTRYRVHQQVKKKRCLKNLPNHQRGYAKWKTSWNTLYCIHICSVGGD